MTSTALGLAEPVARPSGPVGSTDRYHPGAFIEMLVSSIIGLWASLVLSIDAVKLAADPFVDLGCNISSTISCAAPQSVWHGRPTSSASPTPSWA